MAAAYCLPNDSIDFTSRLVLYAQRNIQNPSKLVIKNKNLTEWKTVKLFLVDNKQQALTV